MVGCPANTRRLANVAVMLDHRLRRWTNITPTLSQHLVFAGWAQLGFISSRDTMLV